MSLAIQANYMGDYGTRVLPQGYELKKNILGFTLVVPIGTKGAVIKK